MMNSKWTKRTEMDAAEAAVQDAPAGVVVPPLTEAELEAFLFRGAPGRKPVPPALAQPLPAPHHTHAPAPGRHNDRIEAINEAVRQTSAWAAPLRQEIARVLVGQKHLVDRLLVGLFTNGHFLLDGIHWW